MYAGNAYTFDDVKREIDEGKLQFWPGVNSVIITTIVDYPRERLLSFFLAGGNLPELEAMTPGILEWGKQNGCVKAAMIGRRGWKKTFLAEAGWKETLVVFEKDLNV